MQTRRQWTTTEEKKMCKQFLQRVDDDNDERVDVPYEFEGDFGVHEMKSKRSDLVAVYPPIKLKVLTKSSGAFRIE